MKRATVLLPAALLAVLLGGCTSAGDPAGQGEPTAGTSAAGDRGISPLDAYWREVWGADATVEEREERDFAMQTEIEESIASCMRAAGFSYTPHPIRRAMSDPDTDADGVRSSDREDRDWVSRYGYGIVEAPQRSRSERSGWGAGAQMVAAGGGDVEDPNRSHVEGLSASQRAAYERALDGPYLEDDDPDRRLEDAGCRGKAVFDARGGEDPSEDPRFQSLFEAINGLSDAFPWPGIPELDAAWAACMDDRGRGGFAGPREAQTSMEDEYQALWDAANPGATPLQTTPLSPPADEALTDLAAKERELALIDLDCREDVSYWATYDGIRFDLEEAFMRDHEAELEALRSAYEQWDGR